VGGPRDAEDEDDPTTYVYWREHGFHGPPPKRRGYRVWWFALAAALTIALGAVFVLAAAGRLP
jgi:cytochrome oxidase assembly protein ShyY1